MNEYQQDMHQDLERILREKNSWLINCWCKWFKWCVSLVILAKKRRSRDDKNYVNVNLNGQCSQRITFSQPEIFRCVNLGTCWQAVSRMSKLISNNSQFQVGLFEQLSHTVRGLGIGLCLGRGVMPMTDCLGVCPGALGFKPDYPGTLQTVPVRPWGLNLPWIESFDCPD